MITVYRCMEVTGKCPTWAVYSQRALHAPMCPTCHCNQVEIVAAVERVDKWPDNKAHSAWLAVIDELTRLWLVSEIKANTEGKDTLSGDDITDAFATVNVKRAEHGLPALDWHDVHRTVDPDQLSIV